ncbi:uncharacterized protein LOC125495035 [Beta vulgaris subsp. vulgaris]|uniref:uncharacterized protein LOC125495035 n=1 Tax=Beta vulgaris subsp. vulgaris TaxID=3555 RepID=UPI0020371B7A|nr:uncharacterized protein LOC125495035 [Beta vulgaris subsp. vulgaris]
MAMIGTNLQANSSINLKGMEPKLYLAALKGSFDELTSISNWKEQSTPIGNNILHIHTKKPLQKASKDCKKKINIKFIQEDIRYCGRRTTMEIPLCTWLLDSGKDEAVQVFLERANKASQEELIRMLRMINKNKDTALHEAARRGCEAVVR